jgi:transposase
MRYVGLDVHKRLVQAHFCDEHGSELRSIRFELTAASLSQFAHDHLGPDCTVALEATTNTWAVVDILKPSCGKVVVSNPLKTKAIALSKHKSDRVDACMLAQLLRCGFLPEVWIPDGDTRAARSLAERRSSLVRHGTWAKNRIHSLLHERLIQAPFDPFTLRGRQWLQELQLPARDRGEVDTLLRILDAVANEQAKITELVNADAYGRDGVKLLMTLPGVGAATAQAMMAAIGNISRFDSPLKLASYFGLIPSVHQSADRAYHGKITKQGNSNVRWLLVEVAHHAGRHPGPLGHQFQRIARKKGVNVARVAIARKLAVLAWHLLTKGESYRYASPLATEKKLADLRRSQHVLHPPHLGNRGSHWGHSTRLRKSLATVLATESLPAPTPPKAAETRVFAPLGATALLERLGHEQRVEIAHRTRSPHHAQAPAKAQKRTSTRVRKH